MEETREVQKHPTKEEIIEIWKENTGKLFFNPNKEMRVVDQYDRKELNDHLMRFAQHSAAKGIQPTVNVIVDWLYSKKAFDERDDFVKIERLMEMVGKGEVFPLLIMEVLDYAKKVEKAAIEVHDELGHLDGVFDSLKNLNEALSVRLEVRKNDEKKLKSEASPNNDNPISRFVERLGQ